MFIMTMAMVVAYTPVFTQDNAYTREDIKHFSVGVSAGQLTDNSWIGLEVTLPVMHHRVGVRITSSVHWLEAYKVQFDRWGVFSMLSSSVVVYSHINERSRLYIDLGPVLIIPQSGVSEKKVITGVNALVGIEVFLLQTGNTNLCYNFGIGINYADAYADKLENSPRYSNGFVFSNGIRFYF
ncbi:hypothetical protein SAMN05660236_4485 [Ohtaekwangia koreensis]|uniref:Outer membrane protein beta-barrel domain-containing protein n=2 Tax=Ohtaekwangia koreensis TaxID=688867 RepID=A0A1T5M6A5_9BACT|nr:hypothetical protein SAMN05660236_4485 [Ohtaekwangia koreensis]